MFSATGSLLPGSLERPDTVTYVAVKDGRDGLFYGECIDINSTNCWLNQKGYIPVVSTFTGLARALLGVVHTIVHLVCAIFDQQNRELHLEEAKLGARNIARGLVEAVPIIGNLIFFFLDLRRIGEFETAAELKVKQNRAAYNHHTTLFIYGEEIAKRPTEEVNTAVENLGRKLTAEDYQNIVCNRV